MDAKGVSTEEERFPGGSAQKRRDFQGFSAQEEGFPGVQNRRLEISRE
jgi:hypothetical protein